jgi:Holliday junction resolvase RusA-like endonuclease
MTVDMVSFWVAGTPMQKGSTTRMPNGATLPAGTTNTRKLMAHWRSDVRQEASKAMKLEAPFAGAVNVYVEFALKVPASMPKKYQGWLPHTKRPDLDKLERMLLDALKGICYVDDSQVMGMSSGKVYAWSGKTGANITVTFMSEATAIKLATATNAIRDFVSR